MKALIIYFSASGNTEYGVELIKRGIERSGNSICDIATVNDFSPGMEEDYDLLGIASPVYAFKPSLNILQLVDELPMAKGKACFTFFTMGGQAVNAGVTLHKGLAKRGYVVLGHHEMTTEDSWTTIRSKKILKHFEGMPTREQQETVIEFGAKLQDLLNAFCEGTLTPFKLNFKWHPLHLVSGFYNYPLLSRFFATRVNESKCRRCGRCVKQCPTGRMDFEKFPNPKGKCNGCYGCINVCPQEAIDGWFTRGKVRFRGITAGQKI